MILYAGRIGIHEYIHGRRKRIRQISGGSIWEWNPYLCDILYPICAGTVLSPAVYPWAKDGDLPDVLTDTCLLVYRSGTPIMAVRGKTL